MIPFALSLINKDPVYELGIAWVTEIVAVALGYFVRGFKDSKAEHESMIEREEKRIYGYQNESERD